MRVFAIFQGANYYAPSHGVESIEVHASVTAAIESLRERCAANGRRPVKVTYADGRTESAYYPSISEGDALTLYRAPSETTLRGWVRGDSLDLADYVDASGERHTAGAEAVAAYKRDALANAALEAVGLSRPVAIVELTERGAVRRVTV